MTTELIKALETDKELYLAWQANIAMAFRDAYANSEDKTNIAKIANDGADAFLKLLINKPYPYFIS